MSNEPNLEWLTITDPETGEVRKETARERKNRIARERRALKRPQEAASDALTAGVDGEGEAPDDAQQPVSEPEDRVEPPITVPSTPTTPRDQPRFAWKRARTMGYTLHTMLLAGCTRREIRRCWEDPEHPFHQRDVWHLLDTMYRKGRWNVGVNLMDAEFEGGVKEQWILHHTGPEFEDDERYQLEVIRSPLTSEDRQLIAERAERRRQGR